MTRPTLQQTVDNQTLVIKSLAAKIDAQGDELPPYRCIPTWRVQLARDRAGDPGVCLTTKFLPASASLQIQTDQLFPAASKCPCHGKTMLAFRSGDGTTIKHVCTINAWYALLKQALSQGKWRTIPQTPAELYRSACENVR